ncbi:MAG TPA: sigma-54 dependent transcriptional regulator [Gemmatimonadota bacterium]|nr:sigma-54 dependent transcriptional regulator [Gemmatimonadota bacterium]
MARILIVEDNPTMREGIEQMLLRARHDVRVAPDAEHALAVCREGPTDLVITDYKMEGMNGLELLDNLRKQAFPGRPDVMLITAFGTIDIAVEAMRRGAVDFITKPFDPDEFKVKVERTLKTRALRQERDALKAETEYLREEVEHHFGEIVGRSSAMQAIFDSIRKISGADTSVYIHGESGTGKELVARAVHRESPRRDGPFIKVNCSALSEGLLESELFGHEKGAFTGAIRERKGRFELAHKGTLFLDEIADIPASTQVRLLRVLQEKEIERVGGEETIRVDVRIISATNRDLTPLVEQGRFREDLYYRLHVIPIHIPPLRDRKEDIGPLVTHFVETVSAEIGKPIEGVTEEALEALHRYDWPGNIRELENMIERAIVLSDGPVLGPDEFPLDHRTAPRQPGTGTVSVPPAGSVALDEALAQLERAMIEKALEQSRGVKTRAADILGIKTSALYYKLDKYGLARDGAP